MGAKRTLVIVGIAVAAVASGAAYPRAARAETVCFNLAGGTGCAEAGTPEAEQLAAQQAWYYTSVGLPDPGPWYPATTTTTTPETPDLPEECFILVGGWFCYPAGSPEAAQAAIDEAAYVSSVSTTTTTAVAAPTTTTPPTVVEPAVRVEASDTALESEPATNDSMPTASPPEAGGSSAVLPETR